MIMRLFSLKAVASSREANPPDFSNPRGRIEIFTTIFQGSLGFL